MINQSKETDPSTHRQVYFIHGFVYQWVRPHLKENLPSRHAYQKIEKQLMAQPDWPRMGENTISDGANRLIVEEHDLKNQWKIPLFKGRTGVRMKNRNDSAHGAVVMSTLEAADELSCVVVDNQRESVDGSFPPPPSEKELLLLVPPSPSATAANDSQSQSIDCVYHQAKTHLGWSINSIAKHWVINNSRYLFVFFLFIFLWFEYNL